MKDGKTNAVYKGFVCGTDSPVRADRRKQLNYVESFVLLVTFLLLLEIDASL